MIPVLSLFVLAGVIALSVVTKKNCGIIALIAAYLFGTFGAGMSAKEIYAEGWPMSVFFIVLATTFLFGIANVNGTTKVLSLNIACLARGNNKVLPLLFFLLGGAISAAGAGGLIVAVIMPIALYVAVENGIPTILMSLVTMGGIMVGGLSPLAINGIVAKSLSEEQGLTSYLPMYLAYAVSMTAFSLGAYLLFGGLRLEPTKDTGSLRFTGFTRQQAVTVGAILLVLVGVVFLKQDIGLLSFACAGLLLLLGAADQKQSIAAIPWATILLISGMAVLINVVSTAGGITFLSDKLSNVLTARTAQPIMVILGGLMGAVSSGTGVVMPTLIPLASNLAEQMPEVGTPLGLVIAVIVGTNGVVISPLSTVGGICVASAPDGVDRDKLYNQLLLAAVAFILLTAVAAFIGVYNIFA